jgi:putative ABC transport system permease protein
VILRFVNLRHLYQHRWRGALTITGIAASVCMLVAIGVINATLRKSIQSETHGLSGSASLQVIPAGATPLPASTVNAVNLTPGVQAAVPILRIVSRLHSDHLSERVLLFAVPANFPALFPHGLGEVAAQLTAPSFTNGEVALTARLAASLGVHPGQTVTLQTPNGARSVRVGAILAHNAFASLNGGVFALMDLSAGQRFFGRVNEVSSIYVRARADTDIKTLRKALRDRLGTGVFVGTPGAEGQAYQSTFGSLAAITERARYIGLLVALFLVINTMAMAMAERRQELARLVSAGAQKREILVAFLAEAGVLGMLGAVVGVIAGALLAHVLVQRAVVSYDVLPITVSGPLAIEPTTVLTGLTAGCYVSIIGAAVSASRILRVAPLDALQHESNYEWARQQRRRLPRALAVIGAVAIILTPLTAWQLPIGSQPAFEALALVLAFGGAVLTFPVVIPLLARWLQHALRPLLRPSARLGADGLVRAPGRTAVTAGGIAIAAGFVIAGGSSISSLRSAVDEAAAQWYQAPLYINLEGSTSYIANQPLPVSVSRRLEAVRGVKALYPMRFGLISVGGHQTLIEAMPMAQAAAASDHIMGSFGIPRRTLIRALAKGEVVVSRLTARHYHLKPGDVLSLPTTRKLVTIKIGGVFNDLASFDSVLIEHSVYEKLSGDHQVDRFAVVPKAGANVATVKRRLQRLLSAQGIAATVLTAHQMEEYLVNSIQGLFSLAQGIELAALLVAALTVLSTMVTATAERGREFGIERVLGMTRSQLGTSVVFESTAMTIVGGIVAVALGVGLGLLLTLSLQNQLGWAVTFRPTVLLTLGVLVIATIIGAVAGLYPAWAASRRTIIELLRST